MVRFLKVQFYSCKQSQKRGPLSPPPVKVKIVHDQQSLTKMAILTAKWKLPAVGLVCPSLFLGSEEKETGDILVRSHPIQLPQAGRMGSLGQVGGYLCVWRSGQGLSVSLPCAFLTVGCCCWELCRDSQDWGAGRCQGEMGQGTT